MSLYDKNRRTKYCDGHLSHIYDNISKATTHKVTPTLAKDKKF